MADLTVHMRMCIISPVTTKHRHQRKIDLLLDCNTSGENVSKYNIEESFEIALTGSPQLPIFVAYKKV